MNPIISFCIPTYNRSRCIQKCVSTILEYKGDDIEVVVSDNGSNDDTREILENIEDARFRYYRNEKNEGYCYNFRKVLDYARAEYCFILSDEDLIEINSIPELIKAIKSNRNVSVIHAKTIPLEEKNKQASIYGENKIFCKGSEALENMAFVHGYMTGMIINNQMYINLKKIDKEWYKKDTFYPHEYLNFVLLTQGNGLIFQQTIAYSCDYNNVTYTGTENIKSAYSSEGRWATFTDRMRIIYASSLNEENRERLMVRTFAHCMTSATVGLYLIIKGNRSEELQVNETYDNLFKLIKDFYKKAENFFLSNEFNVSNKFYIRIKRQYLILLCKACGVKFYGTKIHSTIKFITDKIY